MLPLDTVALFEPSAAADEHGWRLPAGELPWEPYWAGLGNLQLGPGPSDPRAADGGGHGPSGPAAGLAGQLFLPPDAEPYDGVRAQVRDRTFVLSQCHLVLDPRGTGDLDCWQATVAEAA